MKILPTGWNKRLRIRASFFSLWIALGILIDEYIKEGYILNPSDFFTPYLTHEKLFLLFLLLSIILGVQGGRRKNSNKG